MKNRISRSLSLLFTTLLLAACSGLLTSGQPPRQVYLLQPLASADSGGGKTVLHFGLTVIPGLDTDRILALGPDARLLPYANARWPDHLPEVLHSVLRRSLESTGRFENVGSGGVAASDQWQLDLELQAFHGILDGARGTRSVRAQLVGRISCDGRASSLYLTDAAAVAQDRLAAVVAAHQAALDGVTRKLIDTIDSTCGEP